MTEAEIAAAPKVIFKVQYPLVGDWLLVYNEDRSIVTQLPTDAFDAVTFDISDDDPALEGVPAPKNLTDLLQMLNKIYIVAVIDGESLHLVEILDEEPEW